MFDTFMCAQTRNQSRDSRASLAKNKILFDRAYAQGGGKKEVTRKENVREERRRQEISLDQRFLHSRSRLRSSAADSLQIFAFGRHDVEVHEENGEAETTRDFLHTFRITGLIHPSSTLVCLSFPPTYSPCPRPAPLLSSPRYLFQSRLLFPSFRLAAPAFRFSNKNKDPRASSLFRTGGIPPPGIRYAWED